MLILVEKTTRRYKSAQRVIVARTTLAAVWIMSNYGGFGSFG